MIIMGACAQLTDYYKNSSPPILWHPFPQFGYNENFHAYLASGSHEGIPTFFVVAYLSTQTDGTNQ